MESQYPDVRKNKKEPLKRLINMAYRDIVVPVLCPYYNLVYWLPLKEREFSGVKLN